MSLKPADYELAPAFRLKDATELGIPRRLFYRWRDQGEIEAIARGIYTQTDIEADQDRLAIACRIPPATLCLTSALSEHGLIDTIPQHIDIAIPRGTRRPNLNIAINWHFFDTIKFETGREQLPIIDNMTIGIYNPQRCLIDAYRLRHQIGEDIANTALKTWLKQSGNQPSQLMQTAKQFPKAQPAIEAALKILL